MFNENLEEFGAGKFKTRKKNYFAPVKTIHGYIHKYLAASNKKLILLTTVFCAVSIVINYSNGLEKKIMAQEGIPVKLLCWFIVFGIAFNVPVLLYRLFSPVPVSRSFRFLFLLLVAPFIFACKYTLRFPLHFSTDPAVNRSWNTIVYWPLLLAGMLLVLGLLQKKLYPDPDFYGLRAPFRNKKTYAGLLLLMVPLVVTAATQPDFQAIYPKLKMLAPYGDLPAIPYWQTLLFELSYGADFLSIELFFRGFLVLTLTRWLGKDAILPVAVFYCSIHFGKPLGECISSYFGGLLLGIIVQHTRSIHGGLMVHLGIAWLMELAGYIVHH